MWCANVLRIITRVSVACQGFDMMAIDTKCMLKWHAQDKHPDLKFTEVEMKGVKVSCIWPVGGTGQ